MPRPGPTQVWHPVPMNADDNACIVRHANAEDLLPLLQLLSRSDEGIRPAVDSASEREVVTWQTMLGTDNLTVYVAVIGSEIVGTSLFLTMPNLGYGCRPSGFIEAVVVGSHWRRRGVARDITQRILSDASSAGCHKIQLLTHKRHTADGAHDFYRSMGFEAEAEGFRLYLEPD